jgi:hypothetical protein
MMKKQKGREVKSGRARQRTYVKPQQVGRPDDANTHLPVCEPQQMGVMVTVI